MKKRLTAGFMAAVMIISLLSGCGSSAKTSSTANNSSTAAPTSEAGEKEDTGTKGSSGSYQPSSALTLVICASAGGDSDINARFFAEEMSKKTGVAVVVSNVSGGSGSIGFQNALDAGTDGNTALFYHTSLTAAASAGSIPNYVSEKFDIISCVISDNTAGWYVSADSPYYTVADIIEAAKAAPDTVIYATEIGASTYATMLMFENEADVDLHPVDVGTAAEKCAALLSGTVDIISAQWVTVKDYVESGQFRCIGFTADAKPDIDSDVETFKDQGVDVSATRYFVMAFPKGTDKAVEDYWRDIMSQICSDTDFQQRFTAACGASVNADSIGAIDSWMKQEDYYKKLENMMRGN